MRGRILWQHLKRLSWPEWRHQPWRNLVALLAVMLGVALAFSVHLINESALSEFSAAVRNVNGQADFVLRGQREGFDEALYDRVSQHPQVAVASPGIDTETLARVGDQRMALRVLGIDALVAPALNIELLPQPVQHADRLAMLHPDAVFLNPTARAQLKLADITDRPHTLQVQHGLGWIDLSVQGRITLSGEPTVVMDLAGVQTHFGWLGRLNHIDVRLQPGADRDKVLRELSLPPGVLAVSPLETEQRVSNLSRAYRVNLTVLALVALFTGSFLVFSILSLSVARRTGQFALLGVMGLSEGERLHLVLAEALVLGVVGSLLGLLVGTGLAQAALKLLAGDLGGGYFPGVAPPLRFSVMAAVLYGSLGLAAALVGAWIPARQAQRLMPAQALKGLGHDSQRTGLPWAGPVLLALGAALAWAPPIGGMPLAAYLAVACLLLGGIACVPAAAPHRHTSCTDMASTSPPHAAGHIASPPSTQQRHHCGGGGGRELGPVGGPHGHGGQFQASRHGLAGHGLASRSLPSHQPGPLERQRLSAPRSGSLGCHVEWRHTDGSTASHQSTDRPPSTLGDPDCAAPGQPGSIPALGGRAAATDGGRGERVCERSHGQPLWPEGRQSIHPAHSRPPHPSRPGARCVA